MKSWELDGAHVIKALISVPIYVCTWLLSLVVVALVLHWVMWGSMGCYGSSEYPWGIYRGPSMAALVPRPLADGEFSAF